ncbi:uncharacterized skeletal organic matrix protein 8-like [Stylophora pistillata]|uniref:uncharacterized skeletal organic matrix protein 8-like n=1 Tax=Stylophora pistillata TaxID=50429 RepID=UPI000C039FE6|nr:uncharacterized skeletal organic matrix protein 8-like [Stylophora pistillata]
MEVSPSLGFRRESRHISPARLPKVITKRRCRKVWSKLPPVSVRRFFRDPICVRPSETDLLKKLKDIGGFNPRYVATNRIQAKKFPNLLRDMDPVPAKRPPYRQTKNTSTTITLVGRKLGNVLPKVAGTTVNQECFAAGSIVSGSVLQRLCSECSAITQLPVDVFPRFINEIICEETGIQFCGSPPIGQCQQRNLQFRFLRFTGNFIRNDELSALLGFDVFVEETDDFDQNVRGCCECRTFVG